jgi:hypothetical protein
MGETGGDADLAKEPLRLVRLRSASRTQYLDGDLSSVLEIFGEIDRSHAAPTDFFLDPVTVRYSGLEALRYDGHAI